MQFSIATTLAEALDAVAAGAKPIAGGTDLVVGARHGKAPLPDSIVAIDRLTELQDVTAVGGSLRIGAGVSHATIMELPAIIDDYTAIADGSALVGSPSTRNVGTLGGNVMNGSPAMDTGAPLVVLDASVVLQSASATREVPVAAFWTGPGKTVAASDELCVAISLPARPPKSGSAYVRLEYRRAMEIAVVGAAASVVLADDGTIADIKVALTAVAPTIMSVDVSSLVGLAPSPELLESVAAAAASQSSPISDGRATDRYRRHTVGVMAKRAVDAAIERATGGAISVPVNRAVGTGAAQ